MAVRQLEEVRGGAGCLHIYMTALTQCLPEGFHFGLYDAMKSWFKGRHCSVTATNIICWISAICLKTASEETFEYITAAGKGEVAFFSYFFWWFVSGQHGDAVVGTDASEQEGREFNPCVCVGSVQVLQPSQTVRKHASQTSLEFDWWVCVWMDVFVCLAMWPCSKGCNLCTVTARTDCNWHLQPERRKKRGVKIEKGWMICLCEKKKKSCCLVVFVKVHWWKGKNSQQNQPWDQSSFCSHLQW